MAGILLIPNTVKVLFFVVWLKITSSWIRKFVDFVFVPKQNSLILYFQQNKFHWVSKLRESFNTN